MWVRDWQCICDPILTTSPSRSQTVIVSYSLLQWTTAPPELGDTPTAMWQSFSYVISTLKGSALIDLIVRIHLYTCANHSSHSPVPRREYTPLFLSCSSASPKHTTSRASNSAMFARPNSTWHSSAGSHQSHHRCPLPAWTRSRSTPRRRRKRAHQRIWSIQIFQQTGRRSGAAALREAQPGLPTGSGSVT